MKNNTSRSQLNRNLSALAGGKYTTDKTFVRCPLEGAFRITAVVYFLSARINLKNVW